VTPVREYRTPMRQPASADSGASGCREFVAIRFLLVLLQPVGQRFASTALIMPQKM
jgi:hypothetical protein